MAAFFFFWHVRFRVIGNRKLEFPSGWFIDIDDICTILYILYFFQNNNALISFSEEFEISRQNIAYC